MAYTPPFAGLGLSDAPEQDKTAGLTGLTGTDTALGLNPDPNAILGNPGVAAGAERMFAQTRMPAPVVTRPQPTSSREPIIAYSPSTGNILVNGYVFNENHAADALASQNYLQNMPEQDSPEVATTHDWRRMSFEDYAQYMHPIVNPGPGETIPSAFVNAVRGMGSIAGGAAAWTGVPGVADVGLSVHQGLEEDIAQDAPFAMTRHDVHNVGDAVEYGAASIASFIPWAIESLLVGGVGFAAGGPPGMAAALSANSEAIAGMTALRTLGRPALRTLLREAGAGATQAVRASRGALTFEEALVQRAAAQRAAGNLAGAEASEALGLMTPQIAATQQRYMMAGAAATNEITALGDTYNEMLDRGVDPNDIGARMVALMASVPYAATETITELPLMRAATGGLTLPGRTRLERGARGLLNQGAIGGAQEAFQEFDIMAAADLAGADSLAPGEMSERLIESGLQGAIGQGVIGGVTGALASTDSTPPTRPPPLPPSVFTPPTPSPFAPAPPTGRDALMSSSVGVPPQPPFPAPPADLEERIALLETQLANAKTQAQRVAIENTLRYLTRQRDPTAGLRTPPAPAAPTDVFSANIPDIQIDPTAAIVPDAATYQQPDPTAAFDPESEALMQQAQSVHGPAYRTPDDSANPPIISQPDPGTNLADRPDVPLPAPQPRGVTPQDPSTVGDFKEPTDIERFDSSTTPENADGLVDVVPGTREELGPLPLNVARALGKDLVLVKRAATILNDTTNIPVLNNGHFAAIKKAIGALRTVTPKLSGSDVVFATEYTAAIERALANNRPQLPGKSAAEMLAEPASAKLRAYIASKERAPSLAPQDDGPKPTRAKPAVARNTSAGARSTGRRSVPVVDTTNGPQQDGPAPISELSETEKKRGQENAKFIRDTAFTPEDAAKASTNDLNTAKALVEARMGKGSFKLESKTVQDTHKRILDQIEAELSKREEAAAAARKKGQEETDARRARGEPADPIPEEKPTEKTISLEDAGDFASDLVKGRVPASVFADMKPETRAFIASLQPEPKGVKLTLRSRANLEKGHRFVTKDEHLVLPDGVEIDIKANSGYVTKDGWFVDNAEFERTREPSPTPYGQSGDFTRKVQERDGVYSTTKQRYLSKEAVQETTDKPMVFSKDGAGTWSAMEMETAYTKYDIFMRGTVYQWVDPNKETSDVQEQSADAQTVDGETGSGAPAVGTNDTATTTPDAGASATESRKLRKEAVSILNGIADTKNALAKAKMVTAAKEAVAADPALEEAMLSWRADAADGELKTIANEVLGSEGPKGRASRTANPQNVVARRQMREALIIGLAARTMYLSDTALSHKLGKVMETEFTSNRLLLKAIEDARKDEQLLLLQAYARDETPKGIAAAQKLKIELLADLDAPPDEPAPTQATPTAMEKFRRNRYRRLLDSITRLRDRNGALPENWRDLLDNFSRGAIAKNLAAISNLPGGDYNKKRALALGVIQRRADGNEEGRSSLGTGGVQNPTNVGRIRAAISRALEGLSPDRTPTFHVYENPQEFLQSEETLDAPNVEQDGENLRVPRKPQRLTSLVDAARKSFSNREKARYTQVMYGAQFTQNEVDKKKFAKEETYGNLVDLSAIQAKAEHENAGRNSFRLMLAERDTIDAETAQHILNVAAEQMGYTAGEVTRYVIPATEFTTVEVFNANDGRSGNSPWLGYLARVETADGELNAAIIPDGAASEERVSYFEDTVFDEFLDGESVRGYWFQHKGQDHIILFADNIESGDEQFVVEHEIAHPIIEEIFSEDLSLERTRDLGVDLMEAELRSADQAMAARLGVNTKARGLQAVWNWIYMRSPKTREIAKGYMDLHGLSLGDAVIEALADLKAMGEVKRSKSEATSLERVWSVIRKLIDGIVQRVREALPRHFNLRWVVEMDDGVRESLNKVGMDTGDMYVQEFLELARQVNSRNRSAGIFYQPDGSAVGIEATLYRATQEGVASGHYMGGAHVGNDKYESRTPPSQGRFSRKTTSVGGSGTAAEDVVQALWIGARKASYTRQKASSFLGEVKAVLSENGLSLTEWKRSIARALGTTRGAARYNAGVETAMNMLESVTGKAYDLSNGFNMMMPYLVDKFVVQLNRGKLLDADGKKIVGTTVTTRRAAGVLAQAATLHRMTTAATEKKVKDTTDAIIGRLLPQNPITGAFQEADRGVVASLSKPLTLAEFKALKLYVRDDDGKMSEAAIFSTDDLKLSPDDLTEAYNIYLQVNAVLAEAQAALLDAGVELAGSITEDAMTKILEQGGVKLHDQTRAREYFLRLSKLYTDIAFDGYFTRPQTKSKSGKLGRADMVVEAGQLVSSILKTLWRNGPKHGNGVELELWHTSDATKGRGNPAGKTAKERRDEVPRIWRDRIADPKSEFFKYKAQIEYFTDRDAKTGKSLMEELATWGVTEQEQYAMLSAYHAMLEPLQSGIYEAALRAVKSWLGSYVPLERIGKYETRTVWVDPSSGLPLDDVNVAFFAGLPNSRFENIIQAQRMARELTNMFGGETFDIQTEDGTAIKGKLKFEFRTAPRSATAIDSISYREVLSFADSIGLILTEKQRAKAMNTFASQSERKRFGPGRTGTPGYDPHALDHVNDFLSKLAWHAAKMPWAYKLEALVKSKQFTGDIEALREREALLAKLVKNGADKAFIAAAERDLLRYAMQYSYAAAPSPTTPNVTITVANGTKRTYTLRGQGIDAREKTKQLIEEIGSAKGPDDTSNIAVVDGARAATVAGYLGMAPASAIMNWIGGVPNAVLYLTANHKRTGEGEGFSLSDAMTNITRAIGNVTHTKYGDLTWLKRADTGVEKDLGGISEAEAKFLFAETKEGILQASQNTFMSGGTEANLPILARNYYDRYMWIFTESEKALRRAVALATYRMQKARMLARGVPEADFKDTTSLAYAEIKSVVDRVVWRTQFDYSKPNRPPWMRGPVGSAIGMFKMFSVSMVELIYHLPTQQQIALLGVLFILGGLKGEPFAEDIMDLYDMLMQKLGFAHDSVELQIAQWADSVLPGSAPWLLRGVADRVFLGGTASTRASMGDLIPLTGIGRINADVGRELIGGAGPVASWTTSALDWSLLVTNYTLAAVGLRDQTIGTRQVLGNIPFAGPRGLFDAYFMAADGTIVNSQGRLISEDVDGFSIFMRALAFYPEVATRANDTTRLSRYHDGMISALRARYVLAYANADLRGDEATKARLRTEVQEWNARHREDMQITNFARAARQAADAARQSAVERKADADPTGTGITDEVMRILATDE